MSIPSKRKWTCTKVSLSNPFAAALGFPLGRQFYYLPDKNFRRVTFLFNLIINFAEAK